MVQTTPWNSFLWHDMLQYYQTLSSALSKVHRQVKDTLPVPTEHPLHDFKPGDYVVVRDLQRKHWRSQKWNGPFYVLLTTHMAVKVLERATWTHASYCRWVPKPYNHLSPDVHRHTPDDHQGQMAKWSALFQPERMVKWSTLLHLSLGRNGASHLCSITLTVREERWLGFALAALLKEKACTPSSRS